ncbi:unnamed protein product [Orchesella dallaii]|uniref:Uncharacterized protein n=1 Tax=Orchesella dallaii TaxID=48710 RepID=A0ABP1RGI9_9HEXA
MGSIANQNRSSLSFSSSTSIYSENVTEGGDGSVTELVEKRATWASKIPYILTLVGYTIGFGDVWRFPHILHSNGGVAFLVPYLIMLVIEGIPLFLLELAVGQRMRKGPVGVFSLISPYLSGIGLSCGMICYVVGFYYNTLSAWVLAFLVDSFRSELPWKNCSTATSFGSAALLKECELSGHASKYYWFHHILKISTSIEEVGEFNGKLAIYLIIGWFLIGLIILNGIKTIEVIVYFTSTLPIMTFCCVLIANHFLDGWEYAYTILWKPDWNVLYDPQVWMVAATQTFFSLGLSFGSLIVFASFVPPKNNCYKDAVSISCVNTIISILATVAIFPVLASQGYLEFNECVEAANSTINNCDLEFEVKNTGEGASLLFIAFAEAANHMPWYPPLWSVFFFLTFYAIGINSTFGMVEGAVMTIIDMKIVTWPRWVLTCLVVGSLMGLSMLFAFGWGFYVLEYLDAYFASWSLLVVGLLEVISIGWVYGLARFSYDIKLMTGKTIDKFMLICLRYLSPILISLLIFGSIYQQLIGSGGFQYDRFNPSVGDVEDDQYPSYVVWIGFLLPVFCLLLIPLQSFSKWLNRPILRNGSGLPGSLNDVDFPEDELRVERGLEKDDDVINLFDDVERVVIGNDAIDKLRVHLEQMKMTRRNSSRV